MPDAEFQRSSVAFAEVPFSYTADSEKTSGADTVLPVHPTAVFKRNSLTVAVTNDNRILCFPEFSGRYPMLEDAAGYPKGYACLCFILIFSEYSDVFSLLLQKDEDNIFILNRRYAPFQLHHLATMAFHHSPDYPIPSLYASYQRKVLHKYVLFPLRNVLVYGK